MSQQGLRQQAFRDVGGSASNYNEDMMTAIDSFLTGTEDHINGKMIEWLQYALGSSKTDLPGLQAEAAESVGANNWSAIGSEISDLLYPPADVTNLAAWFKKGTGITVAGSGVSVWADSSGNGNDLLQGTDANRPSYDTTDETILFNGVDQFLKTAPFTLNQPETVYLLCKQVTWTANDYLFDGDGGGGVVAVRQSAATPGLILQAPTVSTINSDLALGVYSVLVATFDGVNSLLQIDHGTPIVSDAGTNNPGGLTLGSSGAGIQPGHIEVVEAIIYNVAHDADQRASVINYLTSKKP